MTCSRLLQSIVKAPVLAVGSAIICVLFAALLFLASFLIHLIAGVEPGRSPTSSRPSQDICHLCSLSEVFSPCS